MTELMKRYEEMMDLKKDSIKMQYVYDRFIEGFEEFAQEEYDALQAENAHMKAQLTWRPVSEKPKEGQIVFAMIPTGWVVAQYLDGGFYVDDGFTFGDFISGVSHWLSIPPALEGE